MKDQVPVQVTLELEQKQLEVLFPLLQKGFEVTATLGCNLEGLLCDQLGLDPDYLTHRINTIFLNGKPVDEVKSTKIADGDTLALSAAMPGLVGATFRKAGRLASFRGTITYQNKGGDPEAPDEGRIILKLFNLLLGELGPGFLQRGIHISGRAFFDFATAHPHALSQLSVETTAEGKNLSLQQLINFLNTAPDSDIFIQAVCPA